MDELECPVCFEILENKFKIVTPCDHTICMKCFSSLKSNICPLCRYDFSKNPQRKYVDKFINQQRKNNILNDLDFPPLL